WAGPGVANANEIVPAEALFHTAFPDDWPDFNIAYQPSVPSNWDTISLDAVYPVVPHSWVVLVQPASLELYQAERTTEETLNFFSIRSKVTTVKLSGPAGLASQFGTMLRQTLVFAQSEQLGLAQEPLTKLSATSPCAGLPLDAGLLAPVEGDTVA